MKGFCGIDIDKDKTFIAFTAQEKNKLNCLEEVEIDTLFDGKDVVNFLEKNAESIARRIIEKEAAYSLNIEKIFLNLPWYLRIERLVNEVVPLKKMKNLSMRDVQYAKKYLEDAVLDWDDLCLHHFVLAFEMGGKEYIEPPLGEVTKKITLRSMLINIKDKLSEQVANICESMDREFGGFICPCASSLSMAVDDKINQKDIVMVNVGYANAHVIVYTKGIIYLVKEVNFGLMNIFQELEKKFLIPQDLAQDIFHRYVSFKEVPHFKEISLRNEKKYISVSIQAINMFVREYVKNNVNLILDEVKDKLPQTPVVMFVGRLNLQEGFYDFLKESVPYETQALRLGHSSSFGCVRYGMNRFLETCPAKKETMLAKVLNVYKEYF